MRIIDDSLGARLVDRDGNARSFSVYILDLDNLKEENDNEEFSIQLVERASCCGFSAVDAVKMTLKYPDYAFENWGAQDSASYSDVTGDAEWFADYVKESGYSKYDFECQRILTEEEHNRFNQTGEYELLINDDGLDDIVIPKRDIEKEKADFIRDIEKHNAKVSTLDVEDVIINSFKDDERRVWIGVTATIRSIRFSHKGSEYSAEFNMRSKTLKPDYSSGCLAKISYEDDEDFKDDSFLPISEAFSLKEYIPITAKLKTKILQLDK